jgi:hypothetical protein
MNLRDQHNMKNVNFGTGFPEVAVYFGRGLGSPFGPDLVQGALLVDIGPKISR